MSPNLRSLPKPTVVVVVAVMIVALGGVFVLGRPNGDSCPAGSVFHLPAGTCILPDVLVVSGEKDAVEAAVANLNGQVRWTTFGTSHNVQFRVADLGELDRIKESLTTAGFNVRYALVTSLFQDS